MIIAAVGGVHLAHHAVVTETAGMIDGMTVGMIDGMNAWKTVTDGIVMTADLIDKMHRGCFGNPCTIVFVGKFVGKFLKFFYDTIIRCMAITKIAQILSIFKVLSHFSMLIQNRGDRIRTCDFLVPNQAL